MKQNITISFLFLTTLAVLSCGGGTSEETDLPTLGNECLLDNDCDGDGLYTSCDDDDGDANNAAIKNGCDTDLDGYVDIYCTAYEMQRDVNLDGLITEDERDINCDTCPPGDPTSSYDPEQLDSDFDGIGDECSIDANINIGAAYDDSGTIEADESADDDSSDSEATDDTETDALVIDVVTIDETAKIGRTISVDFNITGTAEDLDYAVELIIKKSSGAGAKSAGILAVPLAANLGITNNNFCITTTTGCVTLGPVDITLSDTETNALTVDFDVPDDLEEGKYAAQLRLVTINTDGSSEIISRDSIVSRIEFSESAIGLPGIHNPGIVTNGVELSKNNSPSPGLPDSEIPSSF